MWWILPNCFFIDLESINSRILDGRERFVCSDRLRVSTGKRRVFASCWIILISTDVTLRTLLCIVDIILLCYYRRPAGSCAQKMNNTKFLFQGDRTRGTWWWWTIAVRSELQHALNWQHYRLVGYTAHRYNNIGNFLFQSKLTSCQRISTYLPDYFKMAEFPPLQRAHNSRVYSLPFVVSRTRTTIGKRALAIIRIFTIFESNPRAVRRLFSLQNSTLSDSIRCNVYGVYYLYGRKNNNIV